LLKELRTIVKADSFSYKATGGGNIRLLPKDSTTYRQPKEERAFRIVVKGLHYTTPLVEVKEAFEKLGYKVRDAKNAVSRATKLPLSMFFINLAPAPTKKTSLRD